MIFELLSVFGDTRTLHLYAGLSSVELINFILLVFFLSLG